MIRQAKALPKKDIDKRLKDLSDWEVNKSGTQLSKLFTMPSFINGLAFTAKITVLAEVMQHHPDVELSYGKVKVKLTTHDVKGLTRADFELAKKIDNIRISN